MAAVVTAVVAVMVMVVVVAVVAVVVVMVAAMVDVRSEGAPKAVARTHSARAGVEMR